MTLWRPVSEQVWQGRDDSAEASNAKRIFQTIQQQAQFAPPPQVLHCWVSHVMKA
jgi:formiminoglutamase